LSNTLLPRTSSDHPFRERPVERQVDDAVAAHLDRVRRVVVAKRRCDELDADLRGSDLLQYRERAVLPRAARQQVAGAIVLGRCRSSDPCTRVSRHVASMPSVTPLSVASSTFSGRQLKLASHWNTIRLSTLL
jgi:hypothetical protein